MGAVLFTYSGATAKVTKFSGDVRNAARAVVASTSPYTLNAKSNKQEFYIPRANKANYPNGDYTAELTSGGKVVATTTFRVGTVGPTVAALAISKFYPISQTDNDAWAKLELRHAGRIAHLRRQPNLVGAVLHRLQRRRPKQHAIQCKRA